MISIIDTEFYSQVLKEFNYSFGNIFIFDQFVVSEVKHGVNFTWDEHAKPVIADVFGFLGSTNGGKINFISNRINSYSVMASDWVKFYNNKYFLKSYSVVSDKSRFSNASIEKLFFKDDIKHFDDLSIAVNFIKTNTLAVA
ncbi:hypothetical protein ACFFU1_13480 [Algibacter miyuki]|uniref:Uncharacterized protein n=1 Tax=Algibacter miyuki TaxID=1306933 RepID=A0ABV5H298_9FLAO|nr:hypothetical protein [Algibacter miyuki]MDN3666525.1 hypothetical protein [Algibacter miyuki]